jgi:glycosyltransferase involved in cell wall biosynthesis
MPPAMKKSIILGVDAAPLNCNMSGIGYFIFHLLDSLIPLHPEWVFYLYSFSDKGPIVHFKKYPNVVIRSLPFLKISHTLWSQTTLAYQIHCDRIDLFWATTQSLPLLCKKKVKQILLIYDFVFHYFPETVSSFKCMALKYLMSKMVKRSNKIVCISHGTKDKLHALYSRNADAVIYPPLKSSIQYRTPEETAPVLANYGLAHKKYFVTIGTLEPRKNFIQLVDAYLQILKDHIDLFPLIIVGGAGWKNREIVDKIHRAQEHFPDKIKSVGYISDETISHLLSSARYYLCFSLYEGYGMPLAEARHCRTPVICFDQPELREAAENDAIFLPETGFGEILRRHLLAEHVAVPLPCRYTSTQEKAENFSKLLLKLLDE